MADDSPYVSVPAPAPAPAASSPKREKAQRAPARDRSAGKQQIQPPVEQRARRKYSQEETGPLPPSSTTVRVGWWVDETTNVTLNRTGAIANAEPRTTLMEAALLPRVGDLVADAENKFRVKNVQWRYSMGAMPRVDVELERVTD